MHLSEGEGKNTVKHLYNGHLRVKLTGRYRVWHCREVSIRVQTMDWHSVRV